MVLGIKIVHKCLLGVLLLVFCFGNELKADSLRIAPKVQVSIKEGIGAENFILAPSLCVGYKKNEFAISLTHPRRFFALGYSRLSRPIGLIGRPSLLLSASAFVMWTEFSSTFFFSIWGYWVDNYYAAPYLQEVNLSALIRWKIFKRTWLQIGGKLAVQKLVHYNVTGVYWVTPAVGVKHLIFER